MATWKFIFSQTFWKIQLLVPVLKKLAFLLNFPDCGSNVGGITHHHYQTNIHWATHEGSLGLSSAPGHFLWKLLTEKRKEHQCHFESLHFGAVIIRRIKASVNRARCSSFWVPTTVLFAWFCDAVIIMTAALWTGTRRSRYRLLCWGEKTIRRQVQNAQNSEMFFTFEGAFFV